MPGEIAAIITSFLFSIGPIFFTMAGKAVGSGAVNRTRLVVTLVYLLAVHWVIYGTPLPLDANPDRWFWLALSGLIGFIIGDAMLFQAFITIGTRLTMLIFAVNPIISTLLAWVFLNETLSSSQIAGMLVIIAGVSIVLFDRAGPSQTAASSRAYTTGILLAVGAAAGQAGGMVTAKLGLYGDFPALSGLLIRISTSTVIIWAAAIISNKAKQTILSVSYDKQALKLILLASFIGPFLGVFFSLLAIQNADIGIASTLMSLQPIILLPIGFFFFKEKVTWRAVTGTLIALAGVAVLFLL